MPEVIYYQLSRTACEDHCHLRGHWGRGSRLPCGIKVDIDPAGWDFRREGPSVVNLRTVHMRPCRDVDLYVLYIQDDPDSSFKMILTG